VAAIVNAVGGRNNDGSSLPTQCNYWSNTVVLITWDDWGGWYDDVLPWRCNPGSNGTCLGYSNNTGEQNVYGFRVPLLVVSAYTPLNYISGTISQGGEGGGRYVHDFGSILNFTEYVFGQGGNPLGGAGSCGIGPCAYPYADFLAPDAYTSGNCLKSICPYALSDFFQSQARSFTLINGAKYRTDCFINTGGQGCFGNSSPMDPDDDAVSY